MCQVIGAQVKGTTMVTETMAQYSALMVMEKEYGRDKMRKFLRHELNGYLQGRGGELVDEMPLMLVEDQPCVRVILSRDEVERRATARGVGGRGRPPLHCFAARNDNGTNRPPCSFPLHRPLRRSPARNDSPAYALIASSAAARA